MREYHACSICGRKYAEEELTLFAGDYFCESCLEEETIVCSDCGERIWADQNAGNGSRPLCQRCYDRHYTNCERCGAVISNDEACYLDDCDDPYCECCYHIFIVFFYHIEKSANGFVLKAGVSQAEREAYADEK